MVELNEMLRTLADTVDRLNELGVEYMVTGSMALSVYVTARTTFDIDVILEIEPGTEEHFGSRFAGDYYVDVESIKEARRHNSMFNILNFDTGVKVDCIIRKAGKFESDKFARRQRSRIGDIKFWVISKEDLILSKLWWAKDSHSELQFRDVRNLIESGANDDFIRESIDAQGLQGVWDAFVKWKTRIEK